MFKKKKEIWWKSGLAQNWQRKNFNLLRKNDILIKHEFDSKQISFFYYHSKKSNKYNFIHK